LADLSQNQSQGQGQRSSNAFGNRPMPYTGPI